MSRIMKAPPLIGIFIALLFLSEAAHAAPAELGGGKEWLAWTPLEKNAYVRGFVEGYWRGSNSACRLADELFEVGKPHTLGKGPSGRCEARLEEYTKFRTTESGPDVSAYTTVLTDLYTKYPEYQNIPVVYILSFLTDKRYRTADQLHEMAIRGEMRTRF